MTKLFASFDKEKRALESIFNSYLESPKYDPTGHSLKNKDRNRISTSPNSLASPVNTSKLPRSPCSVRTDHLFNTTSTSFSNSFNRAQQSDSGDMSDRYTSSSTQFAGVSLEGVKQFAKDFDLLPVVIEASVLFEIFIEILADPKYLSMNLFSLSARSSSDQNWEIDIDGDRDGDRNRDSNKDREREYGDRELERGLKASHFKDHPYNHSSSSPTYNLSNTELISEIDDVYSTHSVKSLRPLSLSLYTQIQKNKARNKSICDVEEPLLTLNQVRKMKYEESTLHSLGCVYTKKRINCFQTFKSHLSEIVDENGIIGIWKERKVRLGWDRIGEKEEVRIGYNGIG